MPRPKPEPKTLDINQLPSLPIKMLRFNASEPQMLPSRGACSSVTDNRCGKPSKWRIDYIPQIRQYRILFGSGNGLVVTLIPEGGILNAVHYTPGEIQE